MLFRKTVLFQDTFTEASNTTLESHTPDVDASGLGWNKVASSGSQGASNSLQVNATSDSLVLETGGDTQGILYAAGSIVAHDNIYIQATMVAGTSDDTHHFFLRIDDDASEFICLRFSTTILQLVKNVASSLTQIGTGTAPTAGQTVRLEIENNVIRVLVNGALRIKVQDTSVPAQGLAGYGAGQLIVANDDIASQELDNFELGVLGASDFTDDSIESIDTELASHTPNVGSSWDEVLDVSGGSMFADNSGYIRAGGTTSDGSLYRANKATAWQDNHAAIVHVRDPDTIDDPSILAVRIQDSNNFYALRFATDAFRIYKVVGGSVTPLGSELGSQVVAEDVVRLEAQGTALKAYVNDSLLIDITDSDLSTGSPGVGSGAVLISGEDQSTQSFWTFWGFNLAETKTVTVTSKARIIPISKPQLYQPEDESNGEPNVYFQWYLPHSKSNIYSELFVGTNETVTSLEENLKSWQDEGFEYFDGEDWVEYPADGVPRQYAGNLARVNLELQAGVKYWKVRCYAG